MNEKNQQRQQSMKLGCNIHVTQQKKSHTRKNSECNNNYYPALAHKTKFNCWNCNGIDHCARIIHKRAKTGEQKRPNAGAYIVLTAIDNNTNDNNVHSDQHLVSSHLCYDRELFASFEERGVLNVAEKVECTPQGFLSCPKNPEVFK